METSSPDAISVDVGIRLRVLRDERGLCIRALVRENGISANALSMIERGRSSPTLIMLYKVANTLDVPITILCESTLEKEKVVSRKAGERTRVPFT